MRWPQPSESSNVAYANSGLLCAIDNYPANGVQNCGQSVGNGNYDYWSYWHGASGSWVYASNGPAEQSVSSPANDVEGWRFQNDEPAVRAIRRRAWRRPTPRSAMPRRRCRHRRDRPRPARTTTTPLGSPTAPPSTPTTAKTGPGAAAGATTSAAVGTTVEVGQWPTHHDDHAGGRGATDDHHAGLRRVRAGLTGPGATDRPTPPGGRRQRGRTAECGGGSSSKLLPVILIAVVVAALGGFALFRWRRRPAEE